MSPLPTLLSRLPIMPTFPPFGSLVFPLKLVGAVLRPNFPHHLRLSFLGSARTNDLLCCCLSNNSRVTLQSMAGARAGIRASQVGDAMPTRQFLLVDCLPRFDDKRPSKSMSTKLYGIDQGLSVPRTILTRLSGEDRKLSVPKKHACWTLWKRLEADCIDFNGRPGGCKIEVKAKV